MNNPLLTPQLGLFLWTLIIFGVFLFLLSRFAWKPIMNMIREREEQIEGSLREAAQAREEMAKLTSQNEQLLKQAKDEREVILKEARDAKDEIIAQARKEAQIEAQRMIAKAREDIQSEKMAALTEIKNQVGKLSIDIAEKLLRKEMESKAEQSRLVETLIKEIRLN